MRPIGDEKKNKITKTIYQCTQIQKKNLTKKNVNFNEKIIVLFWLRGYQRQICVHLAMKFGQQKGKKETIGEKHSFIQLNDRAFAIRK